MSAKLLPWHDTCVSTQSRLHHPKYMYDRTNGDSQYIQFNLLPQTPEDTSEDDNCTFDLFKHCSNRYIRFLAIGAVSDVLGSKNVI